MAEGKTTAKTGGKGGGKTASEAFQEDEKSPTQLQQEKAAAQDAEAEAKAAVERRDVVPPQYRARYQETGGNNGDFIADELSAVTKDGGIATLTAIKKENGIEENRWAGMNNGMIRMNLANVLRGRFLRGETIYIVGKEFSLSAMIAEYGKPITHESTDAQISAFVRFARLTDTERTVKAVRSALTPKRDVAAEREARAKAKAEEKAKKDAERAAEKEAKQKEREAQAAKRAEEKKAAAEAKAKAAEEAAAKRAAEKASAQASKDSTAAAGATA
jgi:hypothetical protein